MDPALNDFHDFFLAGAGVAGALIGLLFVVISVSQGRLNSGGDAAVNRVRASAALTAFTNVLVVCMFGLIPGLSFGGVSVSVGAVGIVFLIGASISLRRAHWTWRILRDLAYLGGLGIVFVLQIILGAHLGGQPYRADDLQTLATLVVVCGLVGIARSWELIGAPSVTLESESVSLGRDAVNRVRKGRRNAD